MMTPSSATAGLAVENLTPPVRMPDRLARPDGRPQRSQPLMRKFEVAHLTPSGDIGDFTRIAPALPAFEAAFSAFARGGIVQTEAGPVAVEDLLPGDRVRTEENGFQTLLWRGAMTVIPNAPGQSPAMGHVTRIAAETLGYARPSTDLVLGPTARLYHRAPGVKVLTGREGAFIPARDFVDGVSVVELTPLSPVQVFHLGFAGHERLTVSGIEVESYHPGPLHALGLRGEMLALFLSLFPHVTELEDFGTPQYPRIRRADLDLFDAA